MTAPAGERGRAPPVAMMATGGRAGGPDGFETVERGAERVIPPNPSPDRFDDEEWALRIELAAAYRLLAAMGMDDAIFTHLSLRLPGALAHFLINPYGMLFDEVTASALVRIDASGHKVAGRGPQSTWPVNPAGFNIHSAIHRARADAHCIIHTHTLAGMAVCADPQGLRPLNQIALHFYRRIGRYSYQTIHFPEAEQHRMVAALGPHHALILENHGLITCGETVADAFYRMFYLERACQLQLKVLATPGPHLEPPAAVCEDVAQLFDSRPRQRQDFWIPFLRRALRDSPALAS